LKIQILSDLHTEFSPFETPNIERDILVLAGDIAIGTDALSFLKAETAKSPVIYILGNHEYYGNDINILNGAFASEVILIISQK
jgi:3',5'-cyclic AMP phosphodiesterase CpdA